MKKFIFRIGLFSALIVVLIIFSGTFFLNRKKMQSLKAEELQELTEPIDIAIFGTSHAYTAYDPKVFENELKLRVFNYGAPVQNLEATALLIEQVIRERNIRLGVVDIFHSSLLEPPFDERVADFQYETLDYMDLSWKKIRLHNSFYGPRSVLNVFPAVRNHALWKDRLFQQNYVLSREVDYYKGYLSDLYFDKKGWRLAIKDNEEFNAHQADDNIQLSRVQKRMIDKVIDIFNTNGIQLIFVSSPVHRKYMDNTYFTYQKRLGEYLRELGVTYIDYNVLWKDLDLHLYDFKDIAHVNSSGALKVSRHLSAFIKEKNRRITDNSLEANPQYLGNRYYHLASGYREVIKHNTLSGVIQKSTGVKDIAIFNDDYDRLEVLMAGDSIRDLWIRVEYEMPQHETRNLHQRVSNRISGNSYAHQEFLPNRRKEGLFRGYEFEGRQFKMLKIDCPFSQISNLKIFIGSDDPETQVIELETLYLE